MKIYNIQNKSGINKYLDKHEEKIVNSVAEKIVYKKDEVIIHLGERNRDLMFISKGVVEVWIADKNNKKIKVAQLEENELIGEQNFIIPVRRAADVVAGSDVKLTRYPYKKLLDVLKEHPLIASKVFAAFNYYLISRYSKTIKYYCGSK